METVSRSCELKSIETCTHLRVIDDTLDTIRELAVENIASRHTGTITVEIAFLDGGVRTPTVKETIVRRVRKKRN